MTPATTLSQTYYNEKQYRVEPTTETEVEVSDNKPSFKARLEAGIVWFSQNLTGQYRQPVSDD